RTPEQFFVLALHDRFEFGIQGGTRVADERAPHGLAGANNELGKARSDEISMPGKINVDRSGNHIVSHHRNLVLSRQEADFLKVNTTEQWIARNLTKATSNSVALQ